MNTPMPDTNSTRVTLEKLNIKNIKKGNKIKVRKVSEREKLENIERKNKPLQDHLNLQPTVIRQNSRARDPATWHTLLKQPSSSHACAPA